MRRNPALEKLSPIHALAVQLNALGADRELMAACLGVAPEVVGPLLEVAAAKLARAEQELGETGGATPGQDTGDDRGQWPTTRPATAPGEGQSVDAREREGLPSDHR